MNKTGLIAKISMKYVLPTCIWKYFWRISRDFAEKPEFRGSATARNIRSPGYVCLWVGSFEMIRIIPSLALIH